VADLARTTLFGGYPREFYDAYQEAHPLAPGWREREPLYQLYHLLNHLNLFGESYRSAVTEAIRASRRA
jgi:protein-ribulosamine 3-kinase